MEELALRVQAADKHGQQGDGAERRRRSKGEPFGRLRMALFSMDKAKGKRQRAKGRA